MVCRDVRPHCPSRGRPLDGTRDSAILAAALATLADVGYDRLTMEAVAARAHAGKATLYRRWSSKAQLIVDAISAATGAPGFADTGTLRGDLLALATQTLVELDRQEFAVMIGLLASLGRDPDLAQAFDAHFLAPRKRALEQIFERAAGRGEMSPVHSPDLLTSVLPALLFHRLLLRREPLDVGFCQRVVDEVILPLTGTQLTDLEAPS